MALSLITPPTVRPVTLEDAKTQCSLHDVSYDDIYLLDFVIPAATARAERETGRQLLRATYAITLDAFPSEGWIEVPKPPLLGVDSVVYLDENGVSQTWGASNYLVHRPAGPQAARGKVSLAYGVSWPTLRGQLRPITIQFAAGYGTSPTDVPALLRQAILLDIATLYQHRQNVIAGQGVSEIPGTAAAIYRSFRSYPSQALVSA
jgi:uncharacterized phiE125 gp8 family phage protein